MTMYFSECFNKLWLTCGVEDGCVTYLGFERRTPTPDPAPEALALWERVRGELTEYFDGRRKSFDLPLRADGTAFQRSVWAALLEIPYGQTSTYGELARAVGRPGAARAVGQACHKNPVSILIPCHRAVGASGALTGYAGGLDVKRALLELEGGEKRERPMENNLSNKTVKFKNLAGLVLLPASLGDTTG